MSKKNKVLIVLTSVSRMNTQGESTGFWLSELTHPYYAITDNNIQVDIVSISGGKAPVDPKSIDMTDPLNKRFMDTPHLAASLEDTERLADKDTSHYSGIIFAGGHGTMWDFPEGRGVQNKAAEIYEGGGVVAAICHGPAALLNIILKDGTYLIAGKKVAAFTNKEEDAVGLSDLVPFSLQDSLCERGCSYIETDPWTVNVQSDNRLVTGQNPQSAYKVAEVVSKLLLDDEKTRL